GLVEGYDSGVKLRPMVVATDDQSLARGCHEPIEQRMKSRPVSLVGQHMETDDHVGVSLRPCVRELPVGPLALCDPQGLPGSVNARVSRQIEIQCRFQIAAPDVEHILIAKSRKRIPEQGSFYLERVAPRAD